MKKVMQVFITVFIAAFALVGITSYLNSSNGYSGADTLTVYNWGDYIDPDLLSKFQRETGIRVVYETFDSNEAMLTKIAHGGTAFDIVIPSDYAINKMKAEGMLIPLDHPRSNLVHIDPRFLDLSFDGGICSVLTSGGRGGVYNPELTQEGVFELGSPVGRDLKRDLARRQRPRGNRSRADQPRYSLNDTDTGHFAGAYEGCVSSRRM